MYKRIHMIGSKKLMFLMYFVLILYHCNKIVQTAYHSAFTLQSTFIFTIPIVLTFKLCIIPCLLVMLCTYVRR